MTRGDNKRCRTENIEADYIENQERMFVTMSEVARYCARGWAVHPLNDKKRPLLTGWQDKATTNPDIFRQWLQAWPWANVGIVTGNTSNLLVLDIDGVEGRNSIMILIYQYHLL